MSDNMIRIGIFYDGNYLYHVSNYYAYRHKKRSRISIGGLHDFIRYELAKRESVDMNLCKIVDAHYFRGRFSTMVTEQKGWLWGERIFEDVLMYNGVTTHFWPLSEGAERGADVAFALEVLDRVQRHQFDVCVLIISDSDFIPLVRKINSLGCKVMLLGWDFDYTDERGNRRETRVSKGLLNESCYPVMISEVVEGVGQYPTEIVDALFVPKNGEPDNLYDEGYIYEEPAISVPMNEHPDDEDVTEEDAPRGRSVGTVVLLNQGWGFIKPDSGDSDIFFFYGDLTDITFDRLKFGDRVCYTEGTNERGAIAKSIEIYRDI